MPKRVSGRPCLVEKTIARVGAGRAEQRVDLPHGFGPERARSPFVALAVKACACGGGEVE